MRFSVSRRMRISRPVLHQEWLVLNVYPSPNSLDFEQKYLRGVDL
jgi:hypothetical protein